MGKTEKVREILRNIGIEMFDVFMDEPLNIKGLTQKGFVVHTQAVILTGICSDCLQLNKN